MADPRTRTRIFVLLTLTALALWTGIAWATWRACHGQQRVRLGLLLAVDGLVVRGCLRVRRRPPIGHDRGGCAGLLVACCCCAGGSRCGWFLAHMEDAVVTDEPLAWWRQVLLAILGPSGVGLIVWPCVAWLLWMFLSRGR